MTLQQAGETEQALELFDSLGSDSSAFYAKSGLLISLKQYPQALKVLNRAIVAWPSADPDIRWQRAYLYHKTGAFQTAQALYTQASQADTSLKDYALLGISRCYAGMEEQGKAEFFKLQIIGLNNWVTNILSGQTPAKKERFSAPPPPRSSPAITQANRLIRKKRFTNAQKILSDFIRLYPNSPNRGEAAYTLARSYERQGKTELAMETYLKTAEYQPSSVWADDATFRAGWCHYKTGRRGVALEQWNMLLRRYSTGDRLDETLYWCGRVSGEQGDSAKAFLYYLTAAKNYRYSYYGLKAQNVLSSRLWSELPVDSFDLPSYLKGLLKNKKGSDEQILAEENDTSARQCRLALRLAQMGFLDDAASAARGLESGSGQSPYSHYYLARTYQLCGMPAKAIYWAQKARVWLPDSLQIGLLQMIYPQKYLSSITQSLNGSSLDPALVLAVIRQESKFEASARSRSGARGLMQVMPKTGKHLARMSKVKKFDTKALYHPQVSIDYGTRFLASMVKMFDGSLVKALVAYNAGPGRVREWMKPLKNKDDEDFLLQEIPLAETRKYVKVVMENYFVYKMLLEPL
ncbi:transglycosylase SLT domain-containing protein [candidate division TA06 bacterium]|uniref:Transglycosylase SLT domain-containing protein n=1 Tax=candidate division TA06 bacterium TaxID=2250710 RepID=A0A933I7M7_UNCT6|nr:transglycosylase SLT domain-containing protein [candidate division TA06 bacterium]